MATKSTKRAPKKREKPRGASLIALQPRKFDRDLIASIIGERSVDSMPKVAEEFGISATTVRQSWKANGMPGSRGKYNLVDIALWKLEHDKENEKFTNPVNQHTDRLREIEVEERELKLASARVKYQQSGGQLVSREEVRAEVYAMLTVFRETLLGIPRSIMPLLPAKVAEKVAAEVDKLIRHALKALAEKAGRAYLKEGEPEK